MRKKIKKILIAMFYAAALAPLAYFWTFHVMKGYFYVNLPTDWFFFIFFFLTVFVGVPITLAANKVMRQKSNLIEAAQERAIRSFIYWVVVGGIGLLAVALAGLLGVALA